MDLKKKIERLPHAFQPGNGWPKGRDKIRYYNLNAQGYCRSFLLARHTMDIMRLADQRLAHLSRRAGVQLSSASPDWTFGRRSTPHISLTIFVTSCPHPRAVAWGARLRR